jgi:hypothetical protein
MMRTKVEKDLWSVDKEITSYDNCFDAFRLSLVFGIEFYLEYKLLYEVFFMTSSKTDITKSLIKKL